MTTDYAAERDKRVADFFKVLTELLELCKPLVERAVKKPLVERAVKEQQQKEKKR